MQRHKDRDGGGRTIALASAAAFAAALVVMALPPPAAAQEQAEERLETMIESGCARNTSGSSMTASSALSNS